MGGTTSVCAPARWPRFRNPARSPVVAARIGRVLGISFAVCFATGLLSYYQYHPWSWLPEPADPAWGYRVTQGVHVITGIGTIPLLLAKLWTVYPRLFAWPAARSLAHLLERLSIAVLVAAAVTELGTGFFNVLNWYPWDWDFVFVHRQLGYVVVGAMLVHIGVKLPVIRDALREPIREPVADPGSIGRRGVLTATALGVGTVVLTTAGQAVTPLSRLALLAPRRPDHGPSGVAINRTADEARIADAATSSAWRLSIRGRTAIDFTLAEFEALAAVDRDIPLACVEGWSIGAAWSGPLLLDLVRRVGGDANSRVHVTSLERHGPFRSSVIEGPQLAETVLATHLNGDRLTLDHGYPVRVIAPNRAGVFNTKWLADIEVL